MSKFRTGASSARHFLQYLLDRVPQLILIVAILVLFLPAPLHQAPRAFLWRRDFCSCPGLKESPPPGKATRREVSAGASEWWGLSPGAEGPAPATPGGGGIKWRVL